MANSNAPHLRCNICDYQWRPAGSQSNFFNSLPKDEKSKNRFTVKHHRTGEVVVGCVDCYGFEVSEGNRPTSKQLEEQADALLRQNDTL